MNIERFVPYMEIFGVYDIVCWNDVNVRVSIMITRAPCSVKKHYI